MTLDVGGPVHVVDHGGTGPPMLMVHGLGGSLLDWRDIAPAMTRHHHVWSLDLIGFGRTPLGEREATVGANQRIVDRVAQRVGGGRPVVLMGNSMGGLISIIEASRHPERVAGVVLVDPALPRARGGRLTLMITAAFLVLAMPGVGRLLVQGHSRRRGAERLVDDVLALCTVDKSLIDPVTRQMQVELTEWREGRDEPYAAFLHASRSLVRWLFKRETLEPHMRRMSAPTLLIHGDRDRLVELAAAGAAAALRPDWTFRVMPNTGHIPQMERPREFVRLVDAWMDSLQPAELAMSTSRR